MIIFASGVHTVPHVFQTKQCKQYGFLHKNMNKKIHWNVARSKSVQNVRNSKFKYSFFVKNQNVGWKVYQTAPTSLFLFFLRKMLDEKYVLEHISSNIIFSFFSEKLLHLKLPKPIQHQKNPMLDEMLDRFAPALNLY